MASGETSAIDVTSNSFSDTTFGPTLQLAVGPLDARPRKPFTSVDQYKQFRASVSVTALPAPSPFMYPKKTPRWAVVTSTADFFPMFRLSDLTFTTNSSLW